jgi:hypothetical protein
MGGGAEQGLWTQMSIRWVPAVLAMSAARALAGCADFRNAPNCGTAYRQPDGSQSIFR